MSHRALRLGIRGTERVVGRPRLAKAARLLTNEVRLDRPNDMKHNGELLVQRLARTQPRPVVLDVGCHFGEWSSSLLAQPGGDPVLHAFEPSAFSFQKAQAALRGRATVHQQGLSDVPGKAQLLIVHEGAGSNSLVPFSDNRASGATEEVTLSTVDIFCQEQDIDRIDLLKVDAEGHDLSVIRGAEVLLAAGRVEMIQFEYNWRWIEARVFLLDAFELFDRLGYRVGKITRRGIETYDVWHYELESFTEANYLAYLPSWQSRIPSIKWWGG